MNKQKGNMYPFVTHTWNPIRGKCPHDCIYCYMKVYPQPELHLDEKILSEDLGHGNFIFVGSSTDMWANDVLVEWIMPVLKYCRQYPHNRYLFQSKNPARFLAFLDFMPPDFILGTTIETNSEGGEYAISQAPSPEARMLAMINLPQPKMISIEPIMDFDLNCLTGWLVGIKPSFVSIGADSKGHNLLEPSPEKLKTLIENLKLLTTVKLKSNLSRLLRQELSK